ncbi:MAG: FkbM family methyltransferase [Actinophytocola sp.]|nr:FkbM family methyltransferase [Actinophytocola sp.]
MSEAVTPVNSVTACTIVAKNYLPAATVLARSYLRHHRGHGFVIAVIDEHWQGPSGGGEHIDHPDCLLVGPAAFGITESDYHRMATAYNVTELATSVKPFLLRELRKSTPESVVIYLDPDIEIFAEMPEVAELANERQLVLTPHFLSPMPRDGKQPDEAAIMGSGVFNLGFIATGPGSEDFLDFWAERLRHDAIVAPERQLFTDQRWVDQVPALFGNHVLRDPGFNVAYWNLHERGLTADSDGTVYAGAQPLRFFHFSGYRPETSWLLSHHAADKPRVLLSEHPLVRKLCVNYGAALREAGYAESLAAIPYGFATFPDGEPISASTRALFREGWIRAERKDEQPPPHAFGPDGGRGLRQWLISPADNAQAAAGLHRLALSVWRSRVDLQTAFPQPTSANAAEFRGWCSTSGLRENALPAWAALGAAGETDRPVNTFGVNLAGYLTAQLGVGEMGRIVHEAIDSAGIDVISVVEEQALLNRTGVDHAGKRGRPEFPISVLAVNADQLDVILSHYPELSHERYTIGLWAWELEDFPASLHSAFAQVDEVWTISEFCRNAIAEHSPVPVKTIPVPVRDPGAPPSRVRDETDPTRFLFAFDFNSIGDRKNPWGAVSAFQRAFPGRADVRLTIKVINGERHPRNAERLRVMVADDDRIDLVERYISHAELGALYRDSDCYVSLHRSEGFGLTVAEAMVRRLPVISTNYSSTTEFLDENTGWPIPYRMTAVGEGNQPYHSDAVWADPDLDAAADAMREVADNPAEAARRGSAARTHILGTRSMSAASAWVRTELERAYETWQERNRATHTTPEHPLRRLTESKEALRWRPDTTSPSRLPLAPALRKAVNRAIDHYDVHQRAVMSELMSGVEDSAATLLHRIEELEARQTRTDRTIADTVRENVDRAAAPLIRRSARATDEIRDLSRTVAELREELTAQSRSGDSSTAEMRAGLAMAKEIADRLSRLELRTHDMFHDRDTRADQDEAAIKQLKREQAALYQAARLRHAPVPAGADVIVCDAGVLLLPTDTVVWDWINHHRTWEPSEARLMARLMAARPGAFLDVGAHVGYHTLKLLQSCPALRSVIAVEPDPVNFELLERNITANLPAAVADRIRPLQVAAWDADGLVELVRSDASNSGDNRVREAAAPEAAGPDVITVPSSRLERIPEVMATPVSLIKLDLQGRDHRALDGLSEVLLRDRPDIVCEFSPEAIAELGDDPEQVLINYRKLPYELVVLDVADSAASEQLPDGDIIAAATTAETGFVTLWLRPS